MTFKTPGGAEILCSGDSSPALQHGLEGGRQVQETNGPHSYYSSATESLISVNQAPKQLGGEQLADERRGFQSRME